MCGIEYQHAETHSRSSLEVLLLLLSSRPIIADTVFLVPNGTYRDPG